MNPLDPKFLLIVNAASTWAMTGLIWFVQLVHYPLFDRVGTEQFVAYEGRHAIQTTWVVMPLMLAELGTAALLLFLRPAGMSALLAWLGFALVLAIWASTFFVQVPLHGRLAEGFDPQAHGRLVLTNWIRTALWTARAMLLAILLSKTMAPGT